MSLSIYRSAWMGLIKCERKVHLHTKAIRGIICIKDGKSISSPEYHVFWGN